MFDRTSFPALLRVFLFAVVLLSTGNLLPRMARGDDTPSGDQPAAEVATPDKSPAPDKRALEPLPNDVAGLLAIVKVIHFFDPNDPDERADFERQRKSGRSSAQIGAALEKLHRIATPADRQLPAFVDAMAMRMVYRTVIFSTGPRAGSPAQRAQLIEEIRAALASAPVPPRDAVAAAKKVVAALEHIDPNQAIEVNRQYAALLSQTADAKLQDLGARMEGAALRLQLVGQPIDVSGTEVDGTTFDWSKYRGKVVLIDIWATWCQPCLRELPHLQQQYEQYHDRGFEVVGISVDDDRQALDKFLSAEPRPWVNLHDGGLRESALMTRYGIGGPTMILVDRDGKVLSIRAMGPELDRQLAQLFPTAQPDAAPASP